MGTKIIIENWRRFLRESQQINKDDMKLLFVDKSDVDGQAFSIIIYHVNPEISNFDQSLVILGGISCLETGEPCIPKTMMVGTIYRNSSFASIGLGNLLYDFGFYVAQYKGFGLTSDKVTGTKPAAAKHWKRFDSSSEYTKKKTTAGNDKFDYYDQTPDPDDDCEMDDPTENASDHSFLKKNPNDIEPIFTQMEQNHLDFLDELKFNQGYTDAQISKILKNITRRSYALFMEEYS